MECKMDGFTMLGRKEERKGRGKIEEGKENVSKRQRRKGSHGNRKKKK